MEFENISVENIEQLSKCYQNKNELSCDSNAVNLLIWQPMFENSFANCDGSLYVKSKIRGKDVYRLPCSCDIKSAINNIVAISNDKTPSFWMQEGPIFDDFVSKYNDNFALSEVPDARDYLYSTDDIINLSGKKYHSKRNHIAAFDKKYEWHYESIDESNIPSVLKCAEEWYESFDNLSESLRVERESIKALLSNMQVLCCRGGALFVGEKVVAFTIGSPISNDVFDIHIEKALKKYDGAYAKINNEFAKRELSDFCFINREDDMGLEGLRKAKLSYHPTRFVKKYNCKVNLTDFEKARFIYEQAFSVTEKFDDLLFENHFSKCRFLKENGNIVSIGFVFPCVIKAEGKETKAYYLYALATDNFYRNRGCMRRWMDEIKKEFGDLLFLKPANDSLIAFYEKLGFVRKTGIKSKTGDSVIEFYDDMTELINGSRYDSSVYTLMFSKDIESDNFSFATTME